MAEYKLSYTASEIDEALSRKPIIDVLALPETDIKEECWYRLSTPAVVYSGEVIGEVYEVDGLPTTGELIMTDNSMNVYYNLQDQVAYGYLDSEMAEEVELTAGWYTLEQITELAGFPYGGIVNDESQITNQELFYVVLNTYTLYSYNKKWVILNDIGRQGTGRGAEVFNNPENIASGECSHAEGSVTKASESYAHAEGNGTVASGISSHAEGYGTTASAYTSHAEGMETIASGSTSHAEGRETEASGSFSHAEGYKTKATATNAHAEGAETTASQYAAHAEGWQTIASGERAHAEGYKTQATNFNTHAEGYNTQATNNNAHAEGNTTVASGEASHAEGKETEATGVASHAEGYNSKATSEYTHAEGSGTTSSGLASHAEGGGTISSGMATHAEGYKSEASGYVSHAEGWHTIASTTAQHTQGMFNIADAVIEGDEMMRGTYLHIVGNGADANTRSNAHTVDWDGNAWYAGDVYVGSTSGTNKDDGSKKLATEEFVTNAVANAGGSGSGSNIVVDSELSETSTNPVQNKVIHATFTEMGEAFNDLGSTLGGEIDTLDEKINTLSNVVSDGFNNIYDEINNLSAGGSGSGKELLGEFTLTKDNLTSTTTTGIYTISSDIQTIMSNVFSTLEDGYDVLVAELTLGDLLMVAPCEYFGGSTTLNIAQNIQVSVSTDTESGTIGQFAFTGSNIRCNTPIQTYISYILAGNINMDVKFYKVSGGSGSFTSGKELLGEITLDSTNITASTTTGRYNYSTDLSTTMKEILSKVDNDGYEPIITELTMADTTFYALSHYCSGGTNAMKNIQCSIVYGADELRNFCFGENQMITNESEAINYVISGALTINVKFYKASGSSGSGGGEPYYKNTITLFDGDVILTDKGDGLLGNDEPIYINMPESANIGDLVDITFANKKYECELKLDEYFLQGVYCGNAYIYIKYMCDTEGMTPEDIFGILGTSYDDTGEPFLTMIMEKDGEMTIAIATYGYGLEAGTYDFKVEYITSAKKLDSSLIDWASGGAPSGLPEVTAADNNKSLVVVNGKWTVTSIANGDEVAY